MKLHRQRYGAGQPLIVLHGLLGSLTNWTTLSKQFGAHYQVIAVDQRNHGGSPHSPDMGFDAMADDLRELLADEGIESAHLLGHSMGGKTAMAFALRYPALVQRLVVVDIAPRAYPPHHDAIFAGLNALDLAAATSRGELDATLAAYLPDRGVRQFLLTNVQRDADGQFRWRIDLPAIEAETPFTGPTLFVRGALSDYVQPADESAIRQLFPAARIETIPGAGHWVHAEAPAVFAQVVLGFLAGG